MSRSNPSIFATAFLLVSITAAAAPFDPAKDVSINFHQGILELKVPQGVHLKQRFLKVELKSQSGTVTLGALPPATGKDELGDPVWHGRVRVPLQGEGLKDPVELLVTYQPCSEGVNGVCYRPQHRTLIVKAVEFQR